MTTARIKSHRANRVQRMLVRRYKSIAAWSLTDPLPRTILRGELVSQHWRGRRKPNRSQS